jgi:hypothetical protein
VITASSSSPLRDFIRRWRALFTRACTVTCSPSSSPAISVSLPRSSYRRG